MATKSDHNKRCVLPRLGGGYSAEFMVNLMRFYVAKTPEDEEKALDKLIAVVPSDF